MPPRTYALAVAVAANPQAVQQVDAPVPEAGQKTAQHCQKASLTARVEDMDKITGLTLGADDYVTNLSFAFQ
mgnify:CR=1 FL=1